MMPVAVAPLQSLRHGEKTSILRTHISKNRDVGHPAPGSPTVCFKVTSS